MELEQRVEQLERENRVLKNENRQVPLEVQPELAQEPAV